MKLQGNDKPISNCFLHHHYQQQQRPRGLWSLPFVFWSSILEIFEKHCSRWKVFQPFLGDNSCLLLRASSSSQQSKIPPVYKKQQQQTNKTSLPLLPVHIMTIITSARYRWACHLPIPACPRNNASQ